MKSCFILNYLPINDDKISVCDDDDLEFYDDDDVFGLKVLNYLSPTEAGVLSAGERLRESNKLFMLAEHVDCEM
jgi:hypothetical protein